MAEEAVNNMATTQEEVVVVTDVQEVEEKPYSKPVDQSVPQPEEEETKAVVDDEAAAVAKVPQEEAAKPLSATSTDEKVEEKFVKVSDDHEKKALAEFKQLIQNALINHEFSTITAVPPPPAEVPEAKAEEQEQEVVNAEETNKGDEATIPKDEKPHELANDESEVEVVEKKVSIDEDGTKTVEAIEETVVSVVPPSDDQQQTPPLKVEESLVDESSPPAATQQEVKTPEAKEEVVASSLPPEEVSIWGVPLLKDERSDTILWKFLLARDFKVKDAFTMLKNTIKWRKEFGIDALLEEDLGDDLKKVAFMHGVSKEGHPVCYNVYGAFQDKELYQKAFSDEEKRQKFLKWRVQFLEKSIRKLDCTTGGISTIIQVNDLKNSPGPGKWELRQATKQALHIFQDNYPEFVFKQVFINVPWWYMAVNKMISPFLTQRTKSKFVVAGPSKSAETLFNYIAPEQVPVQYGGFSKVGDFGIKDGVTQIIVKPTSKETVEFAVTEACHLTWDVRVLGWEVSYGAEFVPNAKDGYTVIIQKLRKVGPSEETIISNSFKTSEPGKVVLTIDNSSSKKKRLLYRLKSMTSD